MDSMELERVERNRTISNGLFFLNCLVFFLGKGNHYSKCCNSCQGLNARNACRLILLF